MIGDPDAPDDAALLSQKEVQVCLEEGDTSDGSGRLPAGAKHNDVCQECASLCACARVACSARHRAATSMGDRRAISARCDWWAT